MGAHVSIDPVTRIIDLIEAPVGGISTIDIREHIYSEAKEDWLVTPALRKLRFPLRDPITALIQGVRIGPFIFLRNDDGWRFRAHPADHELILVGDLVAGDEALPIIEKRPTQSLLVTTVLSAKSQSVIAAGSNASWSDAEKEQIRFMLGVLGATTDPATSPGLVGRMMAEDLTAYSTPNTVGYAIQTAAADAASASTAAEASVDHHLGKYPIRIDPVTSQLIWYEQDGVTEIHRAPLVDLNGNSIVLQPGQQASRGVPS